VLCQLHSASSLLGSETSPASFWLTRIWLCRYQRWPDGGIAVDCAAISSKATGDSKASSGFSWGSELTDIVPLAQPYPPSDCDYHITEPALLIKTDFPHHVYHHFTSLFNVWLSLHAAGLPTDGSVRIVFVDKFMHRKTEDEPYDRWLGTFTEAWYVDWSRILLPTLAWKSDYDAQCPPFCVCHLCVQSRTGTRLHAFPSLIADSLGRHNMSKGRRCALTELY
jgi:hypothetical protein